MDGWGETGNSFGLHSVGYTEGYTESSADYDCSVDSESGSESVGRTERSESGDEIVHGEAIWTVAWCVLEKV